MPSAFSQLPLEIRPVSKESFSSFHFGKNQELVSTLRNFCRTSNVKSIFTWGAPGAGKSHLMHAVCNECDETGKSVFYLPLDQHERWNPQDLGSVHTMELVCIDDIHLIAGKNDWELAIFNLFNALVNSGSQCIITANLPHAGLNLSLKDLASRLTWGLTYQVFPLNDDEKAEAIKKAMRDRGLDLTDDVARYLIRHYSRDTNSLFSLVGKLDDASFIEQRRLTIPFIKKYL